MHIINGENVLGNFLGQESSLSLFFCFTAEIKFGLKNNTALLRKKCSCNGSFDCSYFFIKDDSLFACHIVKSLFNTL